MMLEEQPKPIQVNKGAGVRSKIVSVIVNNKEEENQVTNPERKTMEEQEEETQSKTVLSKMRKKIQKLKKPQPNKGKKKSLMSKNEKGDEEKNG